MLRPNSLMTSGMITPTASVVIANIMNMRKVRPLINARLRPSVAMAVMWASSVWCGCRDCPAGDSMHGERVAAGRGDPGRACRQIDAQFSPVVPGRPDDVDPVRGGRVHLHVAVEGRMRITEPDQGDLALYDRCHERRIDFPRRLVVP